MTRQTMLWLMAVALSADLALAADGQTEHRIELRNGREATVVQQSADVFTCKLAGKTYDVRRREDRRVTFYDGETVVASGILKGDELVLMSPDDALFLDLGWREDKVKVRTKDDAPVWEFKRKDGKIKVRVGEKEYGQVKFYPDTGKTKAKDSGDREVAVCRSLGRVSDSLGTFLVEDADAQKQCCLMLVLLLLGR